jgi:hypothetical protein
MQLFTKKTMDVQQQEALVSMTALYFIEEHALLGRDQLEDAKKSLQALFLRTSGEESMLRKLIDILKTTRMIHQSFAHIGNVLTGVSKSLLTLTSKITALREYLGGHTPTAEENADFIGPFLSFSQQFLQKTETFHRLIHELLEARENESRHGNVYRIAREARVRLKNRLSGNLGSEMQGEVETKIRREVVASFDYSEAEANYNYAQRDTRNKEAEIQELLADIRAMCQMAMNPMMREKETEKEKVPHHDYEDVFTRFSQSLRKHPRLLHIKDAVVELFKLYQNSYGMFSLDLQNLNRGFQTMIENADAYFEAKEEDLDIRSKRDKLRRIEGLIPFLEDTSQGFGDEATDNYAKFSRRISEKISDMKRPWAHITEDLLRAKVQAEAELSTRM